MPPIEPFYPDLGKRIQEARERAGMTQQEVADRLVPRMTRASVANMESGKQRVLCHTLVALSGVLSTRPEELLPPERARAQKQDEPLKDIELELNRKLGRGVTTNILTKLARGRT